MIKRNTIQRSLVLEAVNKLGCHATASEIYDEIVKQHPNISKGTVYRNLNQLSESGAIRKIDIPGENERFDHKCHNHYHAICKKCRRVFDVDMQYMENLEKMIVDSHGFEVSGHDLTFNGICAECRK